MDTGKPVEQGRMEQGRIGPDEDTPDEGTLFDLTELFRMFADSTRVRILYALFSAERPVSEIVERLGMSQSAVSHQLRPLKSARLVKARRQGRIVFYSLADSHVKTILGQGLDHVREQAETSIRREQP